MFVRGCEKFVPAPVYLFYLALHIFLPISVPQVIKNVSLFFISLHSFIKLLYCLLLITLLYCLHSNHSLISLPRSSRDHGHPPESIGLSAAFRRRPHCHHSGLEAGRAADPDGARRRGGRRARDRHSNFCGGSLHESGRHSSSRFYQSKFISVLEFGSK